MSFCKICGSTVSTAANLSDGGAYHESCFKSIESRKLEIESEIHEQQIRLNDLTHQIKKRERLFFKITSLFSKDDADVPAINEQISKIRHYINQKHIELVNITTKIGSIYDYLFDSPPDWKDRKRKVAHRDGDHCKKCKRRRNLHLHHIVPLSKGGSNAIHNLQLLCESCHSKYHGGRDFLYDDSKNAEPTFLKRLQKIENAIQNDIWITFDYKKLRAKKHTKRTIKPAKIVNLKHQRDSGATLCVRGFCELRKAERTFAIKRMKALSLCDCPEKVKKNSKNQKTNIKKTKSKSNNPLTLKQKIKHKSQLQEMYEQIEEHDKENLKMMGYDDNEL